MNVRELIAAGSLEWTALPMSLRKDFGFRLAGLYGSTSAEKAFNSLAPDKRNALFLLYSSMAKSEVWSEVLAIRNVYGEGGVGMAFTSTKGLLGKLKRSDDFTTWFARHRESRFGFYQKHVRSGNLHFLTVDPKATEWTVHLDLFNPVGSPLSFIRHILVEKIKKKAPDWKDIVDNLEVANN